MINLMPDDYKESIRFARRNAVLLNWLMGLLVILAITSMTILVGKSYLSAESSRYASLNAQTEQELKDQDLQGTLATVENISNNLKLIVQVLSRQIIFSELIKQVGAVMPANSVLSNIDISNVEGGIDLTAKAKDSTTATQVQVNLADPNNKLFDKVDINAVKCDGADPAYPCTVTLRALFTSKNPFLFINQKGKATQ